MVRTHETGGRDNEAYYEVQIGLTPTTKEEEKMNFGTEIMSQAK